MSRTDETAGAEFASKIDQWRSGLGSARNVVRQELVVRQLLSHLDVNKGVRVLDVGCGQATVSLRLARAGCEVVGVDPAPELLALARRERDQEEPEVRARLQLCDGNLFSLDRSRLGRFDVVCCHGVLMYVPSLAPAISALVAAGDTGTLISTLTRNRAGIAMRAGMSGEWAETEDGFDARHYTNRLGVEGARADEPEAVVSAFAAMGCELVAWYGVRLFTDHWDQRAPTDDFEAVLTAEEEAGRRDPYRRVAALTHVLARVDE